MSLGQWNQLLEQNGCQWLREAASHTYYRHRADGKSVRGAVPRRIQGVDGVLTPSCPVIPRP